MSFTFSDRYEADYPSLGICDLCGRRYTTDKCQHRTIETEAWHAAYIVAETCGELTDAEATALHDALVKCATDPAHILNVNQAVDDWMQRDNAAALYGDGTQIFNGGEVDEFRPYRPANGGDDDMPF